MKYIDAELLRKEIERHLERATAEQDKFPDMPKYRWYLREGKKELCTDLLDYMYDALGVEEPITDSLQQKQSCDTCTNDKGCVTCKDGELWEGKEQLSENLEEAAEEYRRESYRKSVLPNIDGPIPEYGGSIKDAFIAGAEWQKEQMISALKNDGELPIEFIDKFHEIDRNAFQNGQKNVKSLLLKDAVEGEVCKDHIVTEKPFYFYQSRLIELPDNLKEGDKVKIVIVKEDKE